MRSLRSVILCLCLAASSAAHGETLPVLSVQTLSGHTLSIPRDLHAPTIFIIGFTKKSREQTKAWAHRLRADKITPLRISLRDVIVLDDVPGLFRGFVIKQLQASIPLNLRDEILIVTQDAELWKRSAGFTSEDDAYLLLADAKGTIAWRMHGAVSDAGYAALQQSIAGAAPSR
jgi:hypothetical protein